MGTETQLDETLSVMEIRQYIGGPAHLLLGEKRQPGLQQRL
jgi:hypothetical protein